MGISDGISLGSAVSVLDGGAVGSCDGASVSIHEVGSHRQRLGNLEDTFPHAWLSL